MHRLKSYWSEIVRYTVWSTYFGLSYFLHHRATWNIKYDTLNADMLFSLTLYLTHTFPLCDCLPAYLTGPSLPSFSPYLLPSLPFSLSLPIIPPALPPFPSPILSVSQFLYFISLLLLFVTSSSLSHVFPPCFPLSFSIPPIISPTLTLSLLLHSTIPVEMHYS